MEEFLKEIERNSNVNLEYEPAFLKFLKKIRKQKILKYRVQEIVTAICDNPRLGKQATGDQKGKRICSFVLRGVHYRISYVVERHKKVETVNTDQLTILFIKVGSREGFY